MASETNAKCNTCGKEAGKICTQCRQVHYCSLECQRSDWKAHKKQCFPPGAKCTRCLEIIDPSQPCQVPHPAHMLEDAGSVFGGGSNKWSFSCKACGCGFTRSSADFNAMDTAPITSGPEFCYHGSHSIKPLPDHDERRVRDDSLVLFAGPGLQSQINQIPITNPNLSILTIQSRGCYDDSVQFSLEVPMPKLQKLRLIDVPFSAIKLNTDLTPLVEDLFMQNIPDDCDLTVLLPELKSFSMFYYMGDDDTWIHEMLSTSKKLKTFDSYKLRVGPELNFAGNDLEDIRLHRAELLCDLSVYAPNLKMLNLQGCYGLDGEIKILDEHPNFARPPGRGSTFKVNTVNACISRSIAQLLERHPRVDWYGDDENGYGF